MTIRKTTILALSALALLGTSAANATAIVIDFDEDYPTTAPLESWIENGFTLTSNVPAGTLVDDNNLVRANLFAPGTGNDTQSLFWGANGSTSTITMTNDGGSLFSVSSFDASSLYNASGSMTITGTVGSGGTVSQVIALTSDLSLISVTGMDRLSALEFSFDGSTFFAPYDLDNISVSLVPVPAAVWLLGSGLGLLVGIGRRRRRIS